MTTTTINLQDDILDSRDIIAALKDLRDEAIAWLEEHADEHNPQDPEDVLEAMIVAQDFGEMEVDGDELLVLHNLNEEGESTFGGEWGYGVVLVAEWYFQDYAEQLADDIAPSTEARDLMSNCWPFNCIDWERAARELRYDYTSIEVSDHTYLGRA